MATAYADIISLVRAALGDFGIRDHQGNVVSNSQDYADDDISSVITLVLLRFPDYSKDGTNIEPSLASDNDTGALSYYVALVLALPGGTFSMETPNMKYWVQANKEFISHLLGEAKYYLDGGDAGSSIWGALDQLYNEGQLIADRITEAVGNY